MNEQALRNLLAGAQANIKAIEADLASMTVVSRDEYWHQGYQSGRKAELESLVATLSIGIRAINPVVRPSWSRW